MFDDEDDKQNKMRFTPAGLMTFDGRNTLLEVAEPTKYMECAELVLQEARKVGMLGMQIGDCARALNSAFCKRWVEGVDRDKGAVVAAERFLDEVRAKAGFWAKSVGRH